jgi:hypothetical protein
MPNSAVSSHTLANESDELPVSVDAGDVNDVERLRPDRQGELHNLLSRYQELSRKVRRKPIIGVHDPVHEGVQVDYPQPAVVDDPFRGVNRSETARRVYQLQRPHRDPDKSCSSRCLRVLL